MSTIQDYKCPNCHGDITFDSGTQKMKCPYCDAEFDVKALVDYDNQSNVQREDSMDWQTEAGTQWQQGEADGLRVYVCKNCGGEIVGDETTAATACPYCDSPVVLMGQLSGDLKPDLVIPFKKDKKTAIEQLKKHYKGKKLLPKVFKDENHIKEIKGMYVPFWLFDADVSLDARYKGTKIRTWSDSRYYYTETSFFSIYRSGVMGFDAVPVDGSVKMDDALMESVEPFDLSEAVDFRTAYLSGYLADKYDVSADESKARANERIKRSSENILRNTINGFSTVTTDYSSINLENGKAKYALLPVWVLGTEWKGKRYTFVMNGQTGKMVGDLPMDKTIRRKWFWGITAVTAAIVFVAQYLLWLI